MTELRRVRKVGGSLTVTIPPATPLVEGDWIKVEVDGDRVVLTKVVV